MVLVNILTVLEEVIMRVKKYDKLYQLTVFSYVFPISSYVYEENNFLTVIDIGVKAFVKEIFKLSQKLNKKVKFIVITHPHNDHIGGIEEFQKQFPETQFCISKRDGRILAGDYTLDENESQEKIRGGLKVRKINLPIKHVFIGEKIGSLKVIDTKGHTPGSISLYSDDGQVLIVGDAIQTFRGIAIAGDVRKLFPFPGLATWSRENSILSAEKLLKLNVHYLGTGHGNVVEYPNEKILKSINRLRNKIKK